MTIRLRVPHTSMLRRVVRPALLFGTLLTILPPAQAAEQFLDRVVAIVNNQVIMQSELERRSAVIRQQLQERNTRLPADAEFQQQVLDKMINDLLQQQQGEQHGLRINDADLNRTLERIADSNGMNLEQFKQQLETGGQDYREVREQIRSEMLITQVRERLVNQRIQITDQEVDNYLASDQGRRSAEPDVHLAHIMIPIAERGTPADIQAASDQAQRIYQALLQGADFAQQAVAYSKGASALDGGDIGWRNRSELPEKLAAAVVDMQPGTITTPFRLGGGFHLIKMLDQRGGSVQLIKQTRVRHILIKTSEIRDTEQAKALIEDLYQRIRNGEPFDELAKRYSDDPGSGSEGGSLGWATPGQMVPSFETTMSNTAVGELSQPFESPFGWHILEVLERRDQDFGERIRTNQARETIRKRKFSEESANWMRELRAQAYIESKL
ncbi:MAG TPA: peptidylprolyl isomerase [Motiliproteus sp.]